MATKLCSVPFYFLFTKLRPATSGADTVASSLILVRRAERLASSELSRFLEPASRQRVGLVDVEGIRIAMLGIEHLPVFPRG